MRLPWDIVCGRATMRHAVGNRKQCFRALEGAVACHGLRRRQGSTRTPRQSPGCVSWPATPAGRTGRTRGGRPVASTPSPERQQRTPAGCRPSRSRSRGGRSANPPLWPRGRRLRWPSSRCAGGTSTHALCPAGRCMPRPGRSTPPAILSVTSGSVALPWHVRSPRRHSHRTCSHGLGEHQLPAARDASHRRSAWDARRADTGDSGIHWRPYALACWYPARTSRIAAHWSTTGRCWPSRLPG